MLHDVHIFMRIIRSSNSSVSVSSSSSVTARAQMLMSRTSVGVAEWSSPIFLVSMANECCCCACLRLVSSKDSICSWHALKQSWKVRVQSNLYTIYTVIHNLKRRSQLRLTVTINSGQRLRTYIETQTTMTWMIAKEPGKKVIGVLPLSFQGP